MCITGNPAVCGVCGDPECPCSPEDDDQKDLDRYITHRYSKCQDAVKLLTAACGTEYVNYILPLMCGNVTTGARSL